MCFWPKIPDPANSSIKSWTTLDSMQVQYSDYHDKACIQCVLVIPKQKVY